MRRRVHFKRRIIYWLVAALVLLGGAWLLVRALRKPPPAPAPPPVPVVASAARAGDVPVYLSGIGTVQAYNSVTLRARVDGTLDKIFFVEGQEVRAGDVLAQIDPRPYKAQLEQAVATRARDAALLANARVDLQRYQTLASQDSIALQQVDTQRALVEQDAATVQNDQAQIDYAKVQLSYTTIVSPIAGRTGLRLVDAGNIVHATDTTGLVTVTQVEPISVLFTLPEDSFGAVMRRMNAGTLAVAAYLRADDRHGDAGGGAAGSGAAAGAAGGAASAGGDAGAGAGGSGGASASGSAGAADRGAPTDQGRLLLVNNQIDANTGTVQLKATFPNRQRALWPGQFVDVRLLLETRHNAVTVPASAVQRGPQGVFAFVVQRDGTAQMRALRVSSADPGGGLALIDSGIAAGEQVITDGQLKVRAGVHVALTQPGAAGAQAAAAAAAAAAASKSGSSSASESSRASASRQTPPSRPASSSASASATRGARP